jgi:Kef-type K+ transport system membrane component KefB/nucleotide-binding universal stress UspA family protein
LEQPFTSASHHDILAVLVQITVLLLVARAMGDVAQRLGQPAVVGEIFGGMLLGPSFLSAMFPFLSTWLIPQTPIQGYLLELVAMLGAMFIMLITGLEIDLGLIRNQARVAIGTEALGLTVPFVCGLVLAAFLPDSLLVDPQHRTVLSLFLAAVISISAIAVIGKVLIDMKMTRRNIGQAIIAASMIDDTVGWIILSVVVGLADGGSVTVGSIALTIGKVLAFIAFSFTIGRWMIAKLLKFVQNQVESRDAIFSLVVILAFAWGTLSHALHMEVVLGVFVMGILFSQMPMLPAGVTRRMESLAFGIFVPIFFAIAGLKVNIWHLTEPQLLFFTLLIIAVACVAKFAGVYGGARLIARRDHWTALSFGSALNARGAVGIIFATIGLSLNILNQDMFSIVVLMAIVTSLIAPIALRWGLQHVTVEQHEQERLHREEMSKDSLVAHANRVLLPIRYRDDGDTSNVQHLESYLLRQLGNGKKLSLTLLTVTTPEDRARGTAFLNKVGRLFAGQEVTKKVTTGNPSEAILEEVKRNYDLLLLGSPERTNGDATNILFNRMIDYLVRLAPCPTIVVHGEQASADWVPGRILVPTNGSFASRRAAEVGFSMAAAGNAEVFILKVVADRSRDYMMDTGGLMLERQVAVSYEVVSELRKVGESMGVSAFGEVRSGPDPESVILDFARHTKADLIILGTRVYAASESLYFGPRVEYILTHSHCPVIIVNVVT